MVSLAIAKALQIYGIAIVISMIVAVLIKVLVAVTGSVGKTGVKEALRGAFERFAPERTHGSTQ